MSVTVSPKKPVTLCVFAHPDDEAFGPAGGIAILAQTEDVYLVCVTDGNDPGTEDDLTQTRQQELAKSAQTLGIKKVFTFDYSDGGICNSAYHDIADRIAKLCQKLQVQRLLTFEPRGVSGHIDHIALAMICSFVFEKLSQLNEVWYFCISAEERAMIPDYFIYFPEGYQQSDVDLVLNISPVWNQKVQSIKCHQSQKKDMELVLKVKQQLPPEEYYLVKKR